MRICFVCCEYPPGPHGGCGTFTQVLARALVAAGHEVRVIGVYKHGYPAPDFEVDQGVKVWRLRQAGHRMGWVRGRFRLFRQISQWAKEDLIDLVEVPDWQGWAAAWPRLPVPVIVRLNGSASYFARELGNKIQRITFWLERASMQRADYWCSVSEYTAERTREVFEIASRPDAILYNPVEAQNNPVRVGRSHFDVVYSGTLTQKKGIFSLIKAWPHVLANTDGAARLHLYGKDGRMETGESSTDVLNAMLDERQRSTVRWHGHVGREELVDALSSARLAVFPSYAEAFAIAPLEAMSTGCPTVYSRRGSGTELIHDGENGLLVDPDDPTEIAEAITRLIKDDRLASRLGQAGKKLIHRKFTDQALLHQNLSFYASCLGLDPTPAADVPEAVLCPPLIGLPTTIPLIES